MSQLLVQPFVRRPSGAGIACVIAVHGAALWAIWQLDRRPVSEEPQVLTVSLLDAPQATPPAPPRPQTPPARAAATPPVAAPVPLATKSDGPTAAAPVPAPVAAPVSAAPAAAAPAAAATAPTAVATSAPRFDADYLDNPRPTYPPLSKRLGEQGKVVLRVPVGADGLPGENIEIQTTSGHDRLDQAARAVVRRWKFVPARRGNEPVAAWVLVPIAFTLKD